MAMKYFVFFMLLVSMASAATWHDEFDNADPVAEGWTAVTGMAEINSYPCTLYGGDTGCTYIGGGPSALNFYLQNFSQTQGIKYNKLTTWEINHTHPSQFPNEAGNQGILHITDGTTVNYANGIFIFLSYSGGDTPNNMAIYCTGLCSCDSAITSGGVWNNNLMQSQINYSPSGLLSYSRSDGLYLSTIVSGCDITNYNTILHTLGYYNYPSHSIHYYDFAITSCDDTWECTSYGPCNPSDERICTGVAETSSCEATYEGDYSEFTPQACDFCTPSWSCSSFGECNSGNVEPCLTVTDGNSCGESFTGDLFTYDAACTYVPPSSPSGSSTSASRRGEVMYCDPENNCYSSLDEATSKGNKAPLFAAVPGGQSENPLTKFFAWLKSIFGEGKEWP